MKPNFLGIEFISDEIKAMNLNSIKDALNSDTLHVASIRFVTANLELLEILRRPEASVSESHTSSNERTIPANPKPSRESTNLSDSWLSSDSRAEPFTHQFVYQFVNATLLAVEMELGRISWLKESCNTLMNWFDSRRSQLILVYVKR